MIPGSIPQPEPTQEEILRDKWLSDFYGKEYSSKPSENQAKSVPDPPRIIEGPIQWTAGGRNFVIKAHSGDIARINWQTNRLMYVWRQVIVFRAIKSGFLKSVPLFESKDISKINEIDEFLYQITTEWIQLENSLVASALDLSDPKEAAFVKSLDFLEKQKIISIQDQLNGFDIIKKMMEIDNMVKIKKFQDDELEKRVKQELAEKLKERGINIDESTDLDENLNKA